MILSSAYFLVFHGSRSRRTFTLASYLGELLAINFKYKSILIQYPETTEKIAQGKPEMVMTLNSLPVPLIEVAALEFEELSLGERLVTFAQKAIAQGFRRIQILPLFLAPGVHVQQDIPREIAASKQKLGDQVLLELSPYLGKYSAIVPLLREKFEVMPTAARVLVAHGSSLPGVSEYYQNLATELKALMAYWSVEPNLTQQVEALITSGKKQIVIVPYFLFPGKITEALALEVNALQAKYPQVELIQTQPLGATQTLAELIFKEISANEH